MFVLKSSRVWSYVVVAVTEFSSMPADLDERRVTRRFHLRLGELEFGHGHGVPAIQIERVVVLVAEVAAVQGPVCRQ